jgi:hypothetical protein
MANANGWGDGASNNNIGWGKGADNAIGWGSVYSVSEAGATDIIGTPAVDPDAQSFITAAAITDATQQSAINTLVVDLKGYSIWDKMKALYPFVGGTSTSTSYNLKNTAQYQIAWNGGWTWGANGVNGNAANSYGNTGFIPSAVTAQNSFAYGFYSRTNNDSLTVDIGGVGSNGIYDVFYARYLNSIYNTINSGLIYTTSANTNSQGFYIGSRTAATTIKNYKNGTLLTTGTTASSGNVNGTLYIGGFNNNTLLQYSTNRQYALFFISDGLTDTEAANLSTAVQAFQTTLGRNV